MRKEEVNKTGTKKKKSPKRNTEVPHKRYEIHMQNSNRSSHVKTAFTLKDYCSNEVLSFDPQGQEKTSQISCYSQLSHLGLLQPNPNKRVASLSGITIQNKLINKNCGFIMHKGAYLPTYFAIVLNS